MRTIRLVAGSENTRRQIECQLEEFLGGEVVVESYSLDRGLPGTLSLPGGKGEEGALVLTSSLVRGELEAAGLLDPRLPVIVAARTVNPDHLDLVVELSPGTRTLFVNDNAETVAECVEALTALGLDYLDYQPWYPGCPPPPADIEIAITPGETALVPPGPWRVIDLGARVLDFPTLAELLGRLGLLERRLGRFSRQYLTKIIQVAQRLARSTEEARRLNEHLKGVLDSISQGILVYDTEGRVSVCNENLRGLLSIRVRDPRGSSLEALVRNRALLDFLERPVGDETAVFRLQDRDLVVRRFEADAGKVATFRCEDEPDSPASRLGEEYRRRGYIAKYDLEDIVGASEAIQRAKKVAGRLAATDLTILIHGESGTGKELFASAIHAASARRSGPFLAVDLGALSDDLIESELFGYEEGAFTGAKKGGKAGLFELADRGTIFLDEIGNISPKVQTRLLRVLQEREILRVGGSEIKRIDVRVIAASNEDLLERAREGLFREDLYFRLKTGLLRIPPLRERGSDIPLLVKAFLRAEGADNLEVDPTVLVTFGDYAWPGNIRELRNLVNYMVAVREGQRISLTDLPDEGFFEAFARPRGAGRSAGAGQGRTPLPQAGAEAARLVGTGGGLGTMDKVILSSMVALEASGLKVGRVAVADWCVKQGYAIGAGAVRGCFERLSALGLVVSSRGPEGTRLTEAGHRTVRDCLP